MAISAIAEGCEKQMIPILDEVITSVLPYCQDSVSVINFMIKMFSYLVICIYP